MKGAVFESCTEYSIKKLIFDNEKQSLFIHIVKADGTLIKKIANFRGDQWQIFPYIEKGDEKP